MKSGICPKCSSNEVLSNLRVRGGEGLPPYVCGACGYTEFYAENYITLNDERKKGFTSS